MSGMSADQMGREPEPCCPEMAAVDVVIPVYNGERYILATLESVASQTHKPARIIVVDDGSSDSTPFLVRNYSGPVPVEYVRKSNGGLSSARNAGISRCTSDYIAFVDADDEWYPEKLAAQLRIFAESEFADIGVVYCRYEVIDEDGIASDRHYVLNADDSMRGRIFERLFYGNKVAGSGSAVLVKRDCFNKVGVFDENLAAFEDWDMWLRLSENFSFDFSPRVLVGIRRHQGNMQQNRNFMLTNQLLFQNKWCSRVAADAGCIAEWREGLAWQMFNHEMFKLAGIASRLLSVRSRRSLFSTTFGSIWLYLLVFVVRENFRKILHIFRKPAGRNA